MMNQTRTLIQHTKKEQEHTTDEINQTKLGSSVSVDRFRSLSRCHSLGDR